MTDLTLKRLLLGSTLLVGLAAAPAYAQSTAGSGVPEADETVADGVFEQTDTLDEREELLDDGSQMEEMIVTGSRLKRNTFNSITPLQVIDTDFSAQQGLFNPTEILQGSTASSGQQIDSTFGGFVLDNGPGSETVNLRGLGAGRSLVLIDGRRVSPAGVEGAPSQPSINLIPSTFVDDYNILLDGASSVYGSDAVAGVVNAVLKRDFDGLEIDVSGTLPEQDNGESFQLGASYGINADRGFIGFQGEYRKQESFKTNDRDFLAGCQTYLEETVDGEIRTTRIDRQFENARIGIESPAFDCVQSGIARRIFIDDGAATSNFGFGSVYFDPADANTGIGQFTESSLIGGIPVDANGDGVADVDFSDFTINGQEGDLQDFLAEQEQVSFRVVGEYALEGEMNITPYFDVLYTGLETFQNAGAFQFFPTVGPNNPFNPCNPNNPGGTDCVARLNDLLANPNYLATFQRALNTPGGNAFGTSDCFGIGDSPVCSPQTFGLVFPEFDQTGFVPEIVPITSIIGDRNEVDTKLDQTRILGGIKGDLPFIQFGDVGGFSFDISALHTVSDAEANRPGIREDRLNLALGVNPITPFNADGSVNELPGGPCSGVFSPDIQAGCVPVNVFAPSLYQNVVGNDFATQAERDYVFDDRLFGTIYEQTVLDAFVQGSLFTLPGGDVSIGIGGQLRWDDIDSQPSRVAGEGLLFGFFTDEGASGDRLTKELYGEVAIPLGTGKPGFREFNVELAGRLTDDEFYGTNETYSAKLGWRPIDSLLLRGTYGTSFRAPTVRELFLAGQSGFNTFTDPCAVPAAAFSGTIGGAGGYDPTQDFRDARTLENCRLAGLDPTTLGGGNPFDNSEITTGGTFLLDPEESESFTVGASFDQPFTEAFDLEVGVTYYEYEITDSFAELGGQGILNDCYVFQPGLTSPFCERITRAPDGNITLIEAGFVNRDVDTAKGVDISMDLRKDDIGVFGEFVDFAFSGNVNHLTERLFIQTDNGVTIEEELAGGFNFPEWQGIATASLEVDKFRFNWTTNYEGAVEADQGLDQFGNPELNVPAPTNFIDSPGDVFTSGGATLNDVDVIPVSRASDQWIHSPSIRYRHDEDLSIVVGVRNVFDNNPPLVSGTEVFQVNNVAIGGGYDYNGRRFFARLIKQF